MLKSPHGRKCNEKRAVPNVHHSRSAKRWEKRPCCSETLKQYNSDTDLPLYTIDEIPPHLCDNAHIWTGYRMGYTTRMCLRSVLALHNETLNIWTHLVGYILFVISIFILFSVVLIPSFLNHRSWEIEDTGENSLTTTATAAAGVGADWTSLFIFAAYSFGCLMCMLCSTLFHTLIAHENMVLYSWAHALDYFGITFLVVGSFLPFCYFCFSCEPFWRWVYLCMISFFGVIGLLGPFFRQWTQVQHARAKIFFYVCMVGSGVFPIIHIYVLVPGNVASSFVEGLLLMMTLYGVGVFVYVFQIPEFFFPGKFDLYLSSHQIWHVFVLAAAFVHFFNCASMYVNFRRMPLSC